MAALSASASARSSSVGCGSTITTDTTLAGDLHACSADGLVIQADGVTLNLAGHKISGSGHGVGVRILGGNVTVRNGSVEGFGTGIRTTQDLSVGTKLVDLNVSRNTGDGMYLEASSESVQASTISLNAANGIHLVDAAGSRITRNTVFRNAGVGLFGSPHSDGVVYANNNVFENGGDGIFALESTSTFAGNLSRRNGANGIEVRESSGPSFPPNYVFVGNVTDDNAAHGIYACFFNFLGGVPCDGGFTDGGGNIAKHNALSPQCVNISCGLNRGLG